MARAVWGILFTAAGTLLATGVIPTDGMATGPRVGITVMLLMLGITLLGLAWVPWALKRMAKPGDYASTCPVGWSCACGAFNMKPRQTCRSCEASVDQAAEHFEATSQGL